MKTRKILAILVLRSELLRKVALVVAFGLIVCQARVSEAAPMGTAFTYQGHLYDNNDVADDFYDFQFKLYDANVEGSKAANDVNVADVDVIDGYFTVELDFGNVFDGNAVWLGIGVRPGDLNDPNIYTTLSPRQEVTPVPYALQTRGFFVDEAGNVGIGTTNPQARLHVDGAIRSGNTGAMVFNGPYDRIEGDRDMAIGYRFLPPPPAQPNDVDPLTFNSINVGIGTIDAAGVPNPTETLDVNGTARIRVLPDDPCLVRVVVADGTGVLYTRDESTFGGADDDWAPVSGPLTLIGDIYHTGDVGIGTTNPEAKLHVDDAISVSGEEAARVTFNSVGNIAAYGVRVTSALGSNKGNHTGVYADTSRTLGIQEGAVDGRLATLTAWTAYGAMAGVFGRATADELSNFDNSRTSYGLGGRFIGGPNDTLNLNSNGTYWVGGAYGEVSGTIDTTPSLGAVAGLIGIDNAHGSAASYAGYFQGKVRVTDLPYGDFNDVVVADSDGVLHTRDANTLGGADYDWQILGNNNMHSIPIGNVGIGTANPNYKLHVEGKAISGVSSNASGQYATISGGYNNIASGYAATVCGGLDNDANWYAIAAGGVNNIASGLYTTVSGGSGNDASGTYATVGGGSSNTASNSNATVGGGGYNTASGFLATVAGGEYNTASGNYSFAAGRKAKANHQGAFVWGDSTNADFDSTDDDQFLIRASGGVGIGTTSPQGALDVASTTGAFIVPRMTTAQRGALTAVNGMIIYNTTTNQFNFYENGSWVTK